MDRKRAVKDAYQKGPTLNFSNQEYKERISSFLEETLGKDIGEGDATTQRVISKDQAVRAMVSTEENGVAAGIEELVFYYESHGVKATPLAKDGDEISKGQKLLQLEGNAQKLLTLERVGLNIIRRMSGIATITRKYVNALKGYTAEVAATRKVCMEEYLEKKAVYAGGGLTHRLGLDKFIMVKDCHLDILKAEGVENPIAVVIERAYKNPHNYPVEIEVADKSEALKAAHAICNSRQKGSIAIIMLDNMSPGEISGTITAIKKEGLYEKIIFEASGGVNLKTIQEYAKTGVDVVSTSGITEGAFRLNIHQKIEL